LKVMCSEPSGVRGLQSLPPEAHSQLMDGCTLGKAVA
jgi:hypothetical protein